MQRYWNAVIAALVLAGLALLALLLVSCGCFGGGTITAARFEALRANDHSGLRAFLQAMPKGADLHVHLSGAVYVEDFIAWAAAKKLCYDSNHKIVDCPKKEDETAAGAPAVPAKPATDSCACTPPPPPPPKPIADALAPPPVGQRLYDDIVNAQSMRNYHPSPDVPSGHDQFFATFDKYGAISGQVTGEMVATMLRRYAAEHVQHTELMLTLAPWNDEIDELLTAAIDAIGKAKDTAAKREAVKDYIAAALPKARENIDGWEKTIRSELKCGTAEADDGCGVTHRYIAQVNRNSDEAKVFANTAFAAALVRADPRVAGLNFVGPEDYRIARRDYRKHMEMIGALTGAVDGKEAPVALHAGELWIGLVPPDDLSFHITDAVRTAGAKRVGHGVALAFEKDNARLLAEMRRRKVAVEINLTSNDGILGVRGKDHPLMTYRAARVPVVLSTDDAGVSRIDLTNEYLRAARDYPLSYYDLRRMARASIEHSFLDKAEKDKAFKAFDDASRKFERAMAAQGSTLGNVWAWLRYW